MYEHASSKRLHNCIFVLEKAEENKWNKVILILAGAIVLTLLIISGLAVAVAMLGQLVSDDFDALKLPPIFRSESR